MKQVMLQAGQVMLAEVPAPVVSSGCVRIALAHSCISVGTEMSGLRATAKPLWQRAMDKPELVKKVLQHARTDGLLAAHQLVRDKVNAGFPCGYSGAGQVLEVGEGVTAFKPGDWVACAGSQCAYHAEVVVIPENLVVPIPRQIGTDVASTVALGAIALQGVRRATPTLGETFVVLGLGILGQITCQILRAHGCDVIAIDLDRARIDLAKKHGATHGFHPDEADQVQQVFRLTAGIGADGVIITAATPDDSLVSCAFRMCRKKGRVVLVGDVGLNLQREDFYAKELDFLISTSYGPGRYDRIYEEQGLDYPVAHVRWTEGRNMAAYLQRIAQGDLDIASLITNVFPIDRATEAYAQLSRQDVDKPLLVLLTYPGQTATSTRVQLRNVSPPAPSSGPVRVALIGAGQFALATHLPNVSALKQHFQLQAVVSRSGHVAQTAGQRFSAHYCSTDSKDVLNDPQVEAVIIATRHDVHAQLALDFLKAGKHVLVEKPLALLDSELDEIESLFDQASRPIPVLLTGFNRRFSPYLRQISDLIRERAQPMVIQYVMNAGYVPADHWTQGPEGGGRNRGEACHIYDLFTFLTGARATHIHAQSIAAGNGHYRCDDNFVVTLGFEDGSVATLTYTSMGHADHPKERMEIYVDASVIVLDDYRSMQITGRPAVKPVSTPKSDKGQKQELEAFAQAVRGQTEWPIPLWQQIQATRIANAVERQLQRTPPDSSPRSGALT